MRKFIPLLVTLTLLFACSQERKIPEDFPMYLVHANSAKTWILSASTDENDNKIKTSEKYQTAYTFYVNGAFRSQERIHLGSNYGEKGKFIIRKNNDAFYLHLHFSYQHKERFIIKSIDFTQWILESENGTYYVLTTLDPPQ